MEVSGKTFDLAQAVGQHHTRQIYYTAQREGASSPRYSRAELAQQLLADNQLAFTSYPDPAFVVDRPAHPPCSTALESLNRVNLTSLLVNVHNKGKFVLARQTGQLVLSDTTLVTGVEDEHGNVALLRLDTHNRPGEDVLLPQTIIAIKEPHFACALQYRPRAGDEASAHILVQHISDVVQLLPTDLRVPNSFRAVVDDGNTYALRCKEKGNKALKNGQLVHALAQYTEGISVSEQDELTHDITRNRALVHLKLCRFDAAIVDALSSLTKGTDPRSKSLDAKAYYRAGLSAYQLGDFQQASEHFESNLRLDPTDRDSTRELARTSARLVEQSGKYDFEKIIAALSTSKPRVDAADFLQQVEVRASPGRGRGLFSTAPIKMGDLILCEKATCVVYENDIGAYETLKLDVARAAAYTIKTGAMHRVLLKKLHDNPSLAPKVLSLYDGQPSTGSPEPCTPLVDGMPVLDFFQIHEILHYNCFSTGIARNPSSCRAPFGDPRAWGATTGRGIWPTVTLANHSCIGTASHCFIGDLLVMRATKDISIGDEITIGYKDTMDQKEMQYHLNDAWGFVCTCLSCSVEDQTSNDTKQKRSQYLEQLRVRATKSPTAVQDIAKMVRKINETYGAISASAPTKPVMIPAYTALGNAQIYQRDHNGAITSYIGWLKACGYGVNLSIDKVVLDPTFAIASYEVVRPLLLLSQLQRIVGKPKLTAEFDRLAKEFYLIHNGTMHGFDKVMTIGE
ncbi:uncharacterized protein RCC_04998 [Ramularia collo-cygni]|uniref:SET domain-containing protein n=1 Tax=Ramularia collo-cygni TaxID=112498 RepID=A0A2D3UQI0_9PEZI|nr:uncharacterized protein RCC_04998 [Ramularia collo-cygni]CZT19152.1 uncharacterized protein RCC_04998 [Ramularia collo-cygni]